MKRTLLLIVVIFILGSSYGITPLTGVKTINPVGGDYTSFSSAINALNSQGVGDGGVIFNVAAGTTYNESPMYLSTITSSAGKPIVFQKSGVGVNPIIYSKGVNGVDGDYIIGIYTTDYVTFNGIDLVSDPTATLDADKIEFGFEINADNNYGSDHIVIENCTINIERRTDNISQYGIYCNQYPQSLDEIISNLLIDNVTFIKGKTAVYIAPSAIPCETIEISNCRFGELSTSISPQDYGYVIFASSFKNLSFHDNEIQNVVALDFYTLFLDNFNGVNNVYNNKLHNLRGTSTIDQSDFFGIYATSVDANSVLNIYNNLIYDFDGAKSTSAIAPSTYWNLQPLTVKGSAKYRLYNNTIVGSSSNQHENVILCWTTATTEVKNNIFADFSVTGANSFRSLFLSDGVIENNLFWIDESLTNNYTYSSFSTNYKFKEWQKWNIVPSIGYFLTNISANPNFTDRTNFDFTLQNPSPTSNNGQPLGIVTSSLNGVLRSTSAPDIGAYEGDYGQTTDLLPPVIRFQPLSSVSFGNVKLTAEIKDNVGVTDAKLWFRKRGATDIFSQISGVQYGNIWEFSFPSLDDATSYEYFICANDASNNIISNGYVVSGLNTGNIGLLVSNPDANPDYVYTFYYKQTQETLVGGIYTVGAGGNYSSLTKPGGLFEAINTSRISGNIQAQIISDLNETGELFLRQWQESGAGDYTLTITTNNTNLKTITTTSSNSVNFRGVDRVTINGSYGSDNLNHLEFVGTNSSALTFSNDGSKGCSNISIKYCDVSASNSSTCISVGGSNHADFLFEGINAIKGYNGIYIGNITRPIIRNCVAGSSDLGNTLLTSGLYLYNCSDILVENNTIRNVVNTTDNSSAYGIYVSNSIGGSISRNKITGIKNNGTVGNEISDGLCVVSSKNLAISNNVISDINGYGINSLAYSYGIKGVVFYSCDNVKFYYNTVNLFGTGNINPIGARCYSMTTENSVNLDIRNNIFYNAIENSISGSLTSGIVQYTEELSNKYINNIYYVGGAKATLPFRLVNTVGFVDFKNWRSSGFAPGDGRDLGSGFANPNFTNGATNDVTLLSSSPALNSGLPVSVTVDFNGNTRSSTTPDIGAFEDNSLPIINDYIAPVISFVPFTNTPNTTPTFSATIIDNVEVYAAKMWYRVRSSSAEFTGIDGVKQADNITWNFTVTSVLSSGAQYEYFICARDGAGNIITNGITNSTLNLTNVGLSVNNPPVDPSYVRFFMVSSNSISLGTITGSPFYISNTKTAIVNIPFTIDGTYTANTFEAYLSDEDGSFTNQVKIGYLNSDISGIINATIPVTMTSGTNYKIRVISTSPIGIESDQSPSLKIIKDVVTPVVSLTSSSSSPINLPITLTIDFNEVVKDFSQSMITLTNATLSNFATVVTDRKYTVLVTPVNSGVVTTKVGSNQVKDLADNFNGESNTISLSYIELGVPHLNITSAGDVSYFNSLPIALTFTFDQDVTGFVSGDVSVTNGSISAFTGSGSVYTASLTATNQGPVVISVSDDAAINASSKGNSASSLSLIYDNSKPNVSISRVSGSGVVSSAFDIYVDFTEEVKGMTLDKISVTNGASSNLIKESGTRYKATINPSINSGTITVSFLADIITDMANNNNNPASNLDVTINSVQPVVVVSRTIGSGEVKGVFNVTFTFGADVTGFEISDITIVNGSASNFVSTTAKVYTANITPVDDGDVKVKVLPSVAQDAATNQNLASNELVVVADLTVPTVVLSRTSGSGVVSNAFNVTISFSEVVNGFEMSDITISGAVLSNFIGSGSLYSVDVTPTSSGFINILVAANKAYDNAINNNIASNILTVEADIQGPSIVVSRSSGSGTVNSKFNVTFTFGEDVTGFAISDISVLNGIASNFIATSAQVYTADITPTSTGSITISVPANSTIDIGSNGNIVSNNLIVVADITSPTVVISRTSGSGVINSSFNVTFTFSEDVTGFEVADLSITNGTATGFTGSGSLYTANITPTVSGNIVISILSAKVKDLAGNDNTASNSLTVVADLVAPTVTITRTSGTGNVTGLFNVTFTFSEAVTGFELADITALNGTVSNFNGSSNTYTADITPTIVGNISISVDAIKAKDLAGNDNTASVALIVTYSATGIDDIKDELFTVYPNPSFGKFKLNIPDNGAEFIITVRDMIGKVIYSSKANELNTIDISSSPSGIYLISVSNGETNKTLRVIKR